MTAVKGPFVFTSDQFRDAHITKAKAAGCGSLALQLEAAPADAPGKVRAAGLQVIGWGIADAATKARLAAMAADVWMPQAENTPQFNSMITALQAHAFSGPVEPVMTAGGMETDIPNATDAQKTAERIRRHNLLQSFGVTKVWVEVYLQDADQHSAARLGDVNHMVTFFERDLLWGAGNAHPVIGLWTASQSWATNPYSVSRYDLSRHGRTFGAWRAEQMDDARYPEIKAVPPLAPTPPPDPPPAAPTVTETRTKMTQAALAWEASISPQQPQSRITIAKRIVRLNGISQESWRAHAATFKALCDQAEADE